MTAPRTGNSVDNIRHALAEATSAARTAEASANALALTINGNGVDDEGLRGQLAAHTSEIKRLDRGRKVNRRLALLALLLVLVIAVGGTLGGLAYGRFRSYQDCVNGQNDARAQASLDFYGHIKDWANGQYAALNTVIKDPTQKAKATADFLGSYRGFIDYADQRIAQLSRPAKGC